MHSAAKGHIEPRRPVAMSRPRIAVPPVPLEATSNRNDQMPPRHEQEQHDPEEKRRITNARVRAAISLSLPSQARVLVVSKGDDDLLRLDGATGRHFPQTSEGVYAGYHPANSAEAIAHLEMLKAKGADYLLIPVSSFWWLEFYSEFAQYLDAHCRVVFLDLASCVIYSLLPESPTRMRRLGLAHANGAGPDESRSLPSPAAASPWRDECACYLKATHSLDFLGGEPHLLDSKAGGGAFLPLTDRTRTLELDVESCFDVSIAARMQAKATTNQEVESLVSVQYLDGNGLEIAGSQGDLAWAEGVGLHKHLKPSGERRFVTFRAFPPSGAQRMRLRFRSGQPSGQVRIANSIRVAVQRRGISVVVGVYLEEKQIGGLLDCLGRQTLAREHFEVIFVINGPRDRSDQIIREWSRRNPDMNVRLLYEKTPSLGKARNSGIARARFSHVTFVDCDDQVSPGYLAGFYELLSPNAVVLSHIANVHEDGRVDYDNPGNLQVVKAREAKEPLTPLDITSISTMSACKAVPSYFCRQTPFVVHLKSGEDIAFYSEIYSRFPVQFRLPNRREECVYLRAVRPGSMSRKSPSFDFSVLERLEVIACLNRCLRRSPAPPAVKFIQAMVNAQADFMARFLYTTPGQFEAYRTTVAGRNLLYFPWNRVNRGAASCIVFSYCFPPALDASGIVAAKRISEMGRPCDVICNDMSAVRKCDDNLFKLVSPYIGRLEQLKCPVHFADWKAVGGFAELAAGKAAELERAKGKPYEQIYSRAQWPSSHFAAALFKVRRPELKWTAEFSDPLLLDVNGKERRGDLDLEWLVRQGIRERMRKMGFNLELENRRLFYWSEVLPYVLADQLVFTNVNQMKYMLSYCGDAKLRREVERKAVIKPHPIPRQWVNGGGRPYHLDDRCSNLAYFGSFYANRSLAGVFESIARLRADERQRLRLYLFTGQTAETQEQVEASGLWDVAFVLPELDYLNFLQSLNDFDVLIVNDVHKESGAGLNPYLPSKLSDYASSNTPILALYEKGSELSRRPEPKYRCEIRNRTAFAIELANILRSILKGKSRHDFRMRRSH